MTKKIEFDENDLTLEEKQNGYIISMFNVIEGKVEDIIYRFLNPSIEKEEFVRDILLNNAILNFSSKVKLLIYISNELGYDLAKTPDSLHKLMNIRNKFAHNDPNNVKTEFIFDDDTRAILKISSESILKSVSGKGKKKEETRKEMLEKFVELVKKVWKPIWDLMNKLEKYNKTLNFTEENFKNEKEKDKLLGEMFSNE